MVQLVRLQDFKQGRNSQFGPECGNNINNNNNNNFSHTECCLHEPQINIYNIKKATKQAGAELCQAQQSLSLA